jgi:hypothetical protein
MAEAKKSLHSGLQEQHAQRRAVARALTRAPGWAGASPVAPRTRGMASRVQ